MLTVGRQDVPSLCSRPDWLRCAPCISSFRTGRPPGILRSADEKGESGRRTGDRRARTAAPSSRIEGPLRPPADRASRRGPSHGTGRHRTTGGTGCPDLAGGTDPLYDHHHCTMPGAPANAVVAARAERPAGPDPKQPAERPGVAVVTVRLWRIRPEHRLLSVEQDRPRPGVFASSDGAGGPLADDPADMPALVHHPKHGRVGRAGPAPGRRPAGAQGPVRKAPAAGTALHRPSAPCRSYGSRQAGPPPLAAGAERT